MPSTGPGGSTAADSRRRSTIKVQKTEHRDWKQSGGRLFTRSPSPGWHNELTLLLRLVSSPTFLSSQVIMLTVRSASSVQSYRMISLAPSYYGYRFPPDIIAHAGTVNLASSARFSLLRQRYGRSFSRHTLPHPIRRRPACEAGDGAPTAADVGRAKIGSGRVHAPTRSVAAARPT